MSKKIRKKDLLKRLEALEKWQNAKDAAELQKIKNEISRLSTSMNMVPFDPKNLEGPQ